MSYRECPERVEHAAVPSGSKGRRGACLFESRTVQMRRPVRPLDRAGHGSPARPQVPRELVDTLLSE
jgi:hypothetical protein